MQTDSGTLACEISGSGQPVVLLHGLTFDRSSWRPVVERLNGRVRTIAVDLPAHGDSPGPAGTVEEAAAAVHATLRELGVDEPVVVGHSIAGGIASTYAARHSVRGVVTVDAALDVRPFAALVRQLEPLLAGEGFPRAFAAFQQSMGLDRVAAPLREEVLATQRVRPEVVLGYWREVLTTPPDELQAHIDGVADAVSAPVLAVFGRPLAAPEREHLLAHLPQAAIEEWAGAGHFVHLAEPDRFAARLLDFVETAR